MKTATFKNKKYKIFFLFLIFTSLSGFSQKYITGDDEWLDIKDSYDYVGYVWQLEEFPLIKNAECKEPTMACFFEEVQSFIQGEFDATLLKELKGKRIYLKFIVERNGKIKHIGFPSKKPENAKFYKEASRVIKKLRLIGGAEDHGGYVFYKGKNKKVAFEVRLWMPPY